MEASNTSWPGTPNSTPNSTLNATSSSGEIIFKSISALLVLVNMLGNSLVIIIILKRRSMKTPMHYSLLNLAVADLMVGIFVVPRMILKETYPHPQGRRGEIVCKLLSRGNFAWFSTFSSVFSLVFIAFERYYAIMKPLSIRHRIRNNTLKIFIPICWIMSLIFVIPYFSFSVKFTDQRHTCHNVWPPWVTKLYYSIRFLVEGILPTSIMAVLYGRVINRLWFKTSENNATLQGVRRTRKKVTKTMLILSLIYILCWLPDNFMHALEAWLPRRVMTYPDQLHDAFTFLIVLNSTVNPIVYALQFKEFRKGLRKLFSGCDRRCTPIHVIQRKNYEPYVAEIGQVNLVMVRTNVSNAT